MCSPWRLPETTNSEPKDATIRNHRESGTPAARPPLTARRMNPDAIATMSSTGSRLSQSV